MKLQFLLALLVGLYPSQPTRSSAVPEPICTHLLQHLRHLRVRLCNRWPLSSITRAHVTRPLHKQQHHSSDTRARTTGWEVNVAPNSSVVSAGLWQHKPTAQGMSNEHGCQVKTSCLPATSLCLLCCCYRCCELIYCVASATGACLPIPLAVASATRGCQTSQYCTAAHARHQAGTKQTVLPQQRCCTACRTLQPDKWPEPKPTGKLTLECFRNNRSRCTCKHVQHAHMVAAAEAMPLLEHIACDPDISEHAA